MFRVIRTTPNSGHIVMGAQFNPDHFVGIFNYTVAFLYGFLSHFTQFFPGQMMHAQPQVVASYDEAMNWLSTHMQNHKSNYPNSIPWYEQLDKIIYP